MPDRIPDQTKWDAAVSCDPSYDGQFYYAVRTTGIVCRPSCRAKAPRRENVLFFDSVAEAIAAGFRPCKKCRPDLVGFAPNAELTAQAREMFDRTLTERSKVSTVAGNLGVSPGHLARLFKEQYGLSPSEYLARLRVDRARQLLAETDLSVLDIAYTAGFASLSHFYTCFRAQTGCTPRAYREKRGEH